MKRDARIGLAVVLVLGLAVTLLVGRALYKRGATTPPADVDEVAGGDAPASADPHVDTGPAPAAAANAAQANPSTGPVAHGPNTGSRVPEPAVRQFIADENRPITPAPAVQPQNVAAQNSPAPTAIPIANNQRQPTPGVGSDHNPAPPPPPAPAPVNNGSGWEDHESSTATPSAAPADGYGYVVKSGDNMWKISASVYGDGKYTQKIVEANAGMNTQKLKPGTVIHIPVIAHKTVLMKLPSFGEAKLGREASPAAPQESASAPVAANTHAAAPAESAVPAGGTTHKVESGETLGAIAKKYYGSGGPKSVALIVSANKGLEPTKLKVGQELTIPAKK
jgi:nucleoid-associated protein YgaU